MKLITRIYKHFSSDSLYRNSIYLMLSTGVMGFLGFFFWIVNARLYSVEQVGLATTLISVMTLISSFTLLGLNNGLIRYLPTSERKNQKINTVITLVTLASILMSVIYLVSSGIFSPKLLFIRENVVFSLLFIFFIIFSSLNMITESVFIAYRSSKYVLIKNSIFSVTKLIFPIFLIALGAYGIFMSIGFATAITFLLSLLFLVLRFNYSIKPLIDKNVIKRMFKFSLGNYIAGFIGGLPVMVLPIMITNFLGPTFTAYYYMPMMIANFLYIIPLATSQSLFAEGSYSETELKTHLKKATKIISLLLIPAIILTIIFGKYILLAFGKQYSSEGLILLQLLAASGIFNSINYIIGTIFRIKNMVKELVIISFVNCFFVLSLSVFLMSYDLLGVGIAWIIGQILISLISLIIIRKK